jgi:hypothetical protein
VTILIAMNSSKSENSALPSYLTDLVAHEKGLVRQITPIYESVAFSSPVLDQFMGIMPDLNNRLSPNRNLGLSSSCHLRLSPEPLPRLVSNSCTGISSAPLPESIFETLKIPAGKGLEILPDLSGKTLIEAGIRTLSADLPIAPLVSRFATLRQVEGGLKENEKDRE